MFTHTHTHTHTHLRTSKMVKFSSTLFIIYFSGRCLSLWMKLIMYSHMGDRLILYTKRPFSKRAYSVYEERFGTALCEYLDMRRQFFFADMIKVLNFERFPWAKRKGYKTFLSQSGKFLWSCQCSLKTAKETVASSFDHILESIIFHLRWTEWVTISPAIQLFSLALW